VGRWLDGSMGRELSIGRLEGWEGVKTLERQVAGCVDGEDSCNYVQLHQR